MTAREKALEHLAWAVSGPNPQTPDEIIRSVGIEPPVGAGLIDALYTLEARAMETGFLVSVDDEAEAA